MNLKQIEDEALSLTEEQRAELAQKLLLSLDTPPQDEKVWRISKPDARNRDLKRVKVKPWEEK